MSLVRRALAMLARDVPLDRAERALRGHTPKPAMTAGDRMRRDKREWAELHGLDITHELAQERRLWQRMGWDIAPPPEDDE